MIFLVTLLIFHQKNLGGAQIVGGTGTTSSNNGIRTLYPIFKDITKIVVKNDGLCGGKGVLVQDVDFTQKSEIIPMIFCTCWELIFAKKLTLKKIIYVNASVLFTLVF